MLDGKISMTILEVIKYLKNIFRLEILQNPLHGRECGQSRDSRSGIPTVSHRRHLKPFPTVSLSIVLNDVIVTHHLLGFYFVKILLYNVNSQEFENHKLNSNTLVVGQLTKIKASPSSFGVFVFEFPDVLIKEKGLYQLRFELFGIYLGSYEPQILPLNSITLEPFEVFSARKYYSEEAKEERRLLLEESIRRKAVSNILIQWLKNKVKTDFFRFSSLKGEVLSSEGLKVIDDESRKRKHADTRNTTGMFEKLESKKLRVGSSFKCESDVETTTWHGTENLTDLSTVIDPNFLTLSLDPFHLDNFNSLCLQPFEGSLLDINQLMDEASSCLSHFSEIFSPVDAIQGDIKEVPQSESVSYEFKETVDESPTELDISNLREFDGFNVYVF